MSETAPRLRWHDELPGTSLACKGYVGTLGGAVFKVYRPDDAHRNWLGVFQLANSDDRYFHGDTLDDAKEQAERWLERFVSYLGAAFPEMIAGRLSAFVRRVEALEDSDQAAGALTDLAHMSLADGIGEVDRVAFREIILARFPDAEG